MNVDNDIKKAVGWRIRMLRKQRGVQQKALAKLVSIDNGTISNIEKGKWNVSIELLVKIVCIGLGINLTEFFNDEIFNYYPRKRSDQSNPGTLFSIPGTTLPDQDK